MYEDIPIYTNLNEQASRPLVLSMRLACNTGDDRIAENVRRNSAREEVPWMRFHNAHEDVAVIVGGGPSVEDCVSQIADLQRRGAKIIALNAASSWLRASGINTDYQCMIDARPENIDLLDRLAPTHLLASQVCPDVLEAASNPILMHLLTANVEDHLPEERKARGDYALVGGGYGVGNTAICAAYVMGHRTIHCFGFDSSHCGERSHAYPQPMNDGIPCIQTEWAGATYISSLPMKAHAERFQIVARDLQRLGCKVHVHGEGLLPAMWSARTDGLSEREKYQLMWQFDSYRTLSPGECVVPLFLDLVKPDGLVVDFGCGTGRAGLEIAKAGLPVLLVDFADNCRDQEALGLPFLEWDLVLPMPPRAKFGICTDVLEHLNGKDVKKVVYNIMECAEIVFFQISTVPDAFGTLIGQQLHLTVQPHNWWNDLFTSLGYCVDFELDCGNASQFVVLKLNADEKMPAMCGIQASNH